MECTRLIKLVKSWYIQVQEESLAPARMVSFMEKHVTECARCLLDPSVKKDVDRITRIILPPSKMIKLSKPSKDEDDESESVPVETTDENEDSSEEVVDDVFVDDDDID